MTALQSFLSSVKGSRGFWLVSPYAAWMVLMAVLPQTAFCYALRGAITALVLAASALVLCPRPAETVFARGFLRSLLAGVLAGLAVLVIWIAPEMWFSAGRPVAASDSPYSPETCGIILTLAKLAASALVIPVAEELFFRRWLVDFAGFWWMIVLFAVEHGERWHVGAIAGLVYAIAARRYGLRAAIIAHIVTNLALGLIVIGCGRWQFW